MELMRRCPPSFYGTTTTHRRSQISDAEPKGRSGPSLFTCAHLPIAAFQRDIMSWSEDVLSGLSAETMKALREFASKSGIAMESEDDSTENVLQSVLHHFKPPTERETIFDIVYETSEGIVPAKKVSFKVKGVKRELGQTLESTGLTM